MENIAAEILINANQVARHQTYGDAYEFVLNGHLEVLECVRLCSLTQGSVKPIVDKCSALNGLLFELNHVRINPKLDNRFIIDRLTQAFNAIDVGVANKPPQDSMSICYKPLGEISHIVRFFFNQDGKLTFLSPAMRPKLVHSNNV